MEYFLYFQNKMPQTTISVSRGTYVYPPIAIVQIDSYSKVNKIHAAIVVTRTIMDGRTDSQTMATESPVTSTHCSVRYEVTWE
jgi:hypothetical protein